MLSKLACAAPYGASDTFKTHQVSCRSAHFSVARWCNRSQDGAALMPVDADHSYFFASSLYISDLSGQSSG
eukprot:scaffold36630_cov20-Prasinocladus_malaysianus.AAC.2